MEEPIPLKTMFILCLILLCEPISTTVLFPFIFFLVESFGISSEKVGYYVGFIASSFSLAQFSTSFLWGRLSDKIGRKPVLLLGLFGNSITMLAFGFCHSLTWAILTRSVCGILNGNIGVAKSVIGEITPSKNRGAAFSLIGLVNGIGLILGTSIGGMLSWPDRAFPKIFGGVQLFIDNPFLLPCICSSMVSLIAISVTFFFFPETLQQHVEEELNVNEQLQFNEDIIGDSLEQPLLSVSSDIETPLLESEIQPANSVSLQASIGYALIAFENIVFAEVLPLWSIAPPPIGLGFTAVQIGLLLSSVGVVAIICQLIIYPLASRYFTAITLYRVPIIGLCVIFMFIPFIPYLSNDLVLAKYVWPSLIFAMGVKSISENFIFTSIMVLITETAAPGKLGHVNGIAQAGVAGVRAVGPALGGIIWAWSLNNGLSLPFNHFFIFILIMCTILIMFWLAIYKLR